MNRAFAVDNLVFERDQIRRVTSIRPEISQIVLEGQQGEEFVLSIDKFHTRVAQGQYRWKPGHPASDLQAVA
ncbi:hypothetical protein, partial [Pseudomonas viridiflava]|uniref:hypothetical protein n=1 Tax=Pseudomonas viridiflava TaxID=33069 RepID=UPI0019D2B752